MFEMYANPLILTREQRRREGLAGYRQLGSWLSSAFKKVTGVSLSTVTPALVSSIPVVGGVVSSVLSTAQQAAAAQAGPQQQPQQQPAQQASDSKESLPGWVVPAGIAVGAALLLRK